MKIKIKSHGDEVTDFYDKKMDSNNARLAATSLASALEKDENCYLQVFLKECKYIEKMVIRHTADFIENSSDDSDEE